VQNTFWQSGNDSIWFLKNHISEYVNGTRDPPPSWQMPFQISILIIGTFPLDSHWTRWSFSFILGPLHWSFSWQWQPCIAVCGLVMTLLWTELADFAQFFPTSREQRNIVQLCTNVIYTYCIYTDVVNCNGN